MTASARKNRLAKIAKRKAKKERKKDEKPS